jgi:hypothetical protein
MATVKSPIEGSLVTDAIYINIKNSDGTKYARIKRTDATQMATGSTIKQNADWVDGDESKIEYLVYDNNNWKKVNKNDFLKFKPTSGQGNKEQKKSTIPQYSQLSSAPGLQDLVGFTTPQVGLARIATGQAESVSITDNILSEELKKIKKLINF